MEILVGKDNLEATACDGLVVAVPEKAKLDGPLAALDKQSGGLLRTLMQAGEIKGRYKEFTIVHTPGAPFPRIVVLGLGDREKFEEDRLRSVAARGARILRRLGAHRIAMPTHSWLGVEAGRAAAAIVEGAVMGLYKFRKYKGSKEAPHEIASLSVVPVQGDDGAAVRRGVEHGRLLADAVLFARNLINEPANQMTPRRFAALAEQMAKETGLELDVLDEKAIKSHGMGALMAVAQGSEEPARVVVLKHLKGGKKSPVIGLVGKGITFDSGGLSLKDAEGMYRMYSDMSGAAAVAAAMGAIARLKIKANVVGVCPLTENMPSGTAYRPGDIVRSMEGKTIEILNTDAEGRLALADGLAYARKIGAQRLIDVATLTGACSVALGHQASGLFTNDEAFGKLVQEAGTACGERYWPLPLYDEYMDLIRSDVADLENTGGRWGGASTAAIFLREFTGGVPWAHLDIAPTAFMDGDKTMYASKPYLPKEGGTGVAVRTLVGVVERIAGA
ncbi:MAG: leucyl aminopeptidase [Candidatus Xenobia bacterium]